MEPPIVPFLVFFVFVAKVPLFSCLGTMEAGADMVLLYGHFVPKLALNVFTEFTPHPSECDSASWALWSFLMKTSLFISVSRRSKAGRHTQTDGIVSTFFSASVCYLSERKCCRIFPNLSAPPGTASQSDSEKTPRSGFSFRLGNCATDI